MSLTDLINRAIEVKQETVEENNDAGRIGALFHDILIALSDEIAMRGSAITSEATARNTAITQAITDLKAGAPAAYDTLIEIANKFKDDDGVIAGMLAEINALKNIGTKCFLLSITTAPTANFAAGDKYYNSTDKLIHECSLVAGVPAWNLTSHPEVGVFYIFDSAVYAWGEDSQNLSLVPDAENITEIAENIVRDIAVANAGGTPKGTYATLAALTAAFPTGTVGIYVVLNTGHWHYWNGSVWADGGVYLETVNAPSQTALKMNLFNLKAELQENKMVFNSNIISYQGSKCTFPLEINPAKTLFINNSATVSRWSLGLFQDANGSSISQFDIYANSNAINPPSNAKYVVLNISSTDGGEKTIDISNFVVTQLDNYEGGYLPYISYKGYSLEYDAKKMKYASERSTSYLKSFSTVMPTGEINYMARLDKSSCRRKAISIKLYTTKNSTFQYGRLVYLNGKYYQSKAIGQISAMNGINSYEINVQLNVGEFIYIRNNDYSSLYVNSNAQESLFYKNGSIVNQYDVSYSIEYELLDIVNGQSNQLSILNNSYGTLMQGRTRIDTSAVTYPNQYVFDLNGNKTTPFLWQSSDSILLPELPQERIISVIGQNSSQIPLIVFKNANDEFISGVPFEDSEPLICEVPIDAKYYILQRVSNWGSLISVQVVNQNPVDRSNDVANITIKLPTKVYTVANNINLKSDERNYSATLYLDNLIQTNLTHEYNRLRFTEKKSVKFSIPFYSTTFSDLEEPAFNNGQNKTSNPVTIKIDGNSNSTEIYSTINRCTLNSYTANAKIFVLFIGDSITYGQNAFFPNSSQYACFTLLLKELFEKDKLQNGGSGYEFRTIGTQKRSRTFNYNGSSHTIDIYHEGYQGRTLSGMMTNSIFTDSNGNFSINNYVSKYRTCDDNGNRLYFDANQKTTGSAGSNNKGYLANGSDSGLLIGSLVWNTMVHDVFTPTHVFEFMGTNAAVTQSVMDSFISLCKNDVPSIKIGIGSPNTAGTYFPSLYPSVHNAAYWDRGWINANQKATQVLLESIYDNSTFENQNVFVVPTYYVNPAALAFGCYRSNEPFSEFTSELVTDYLVPKGQATEIHVGGYAHAAYAYQIYAWLKWTV